MGGKLLLRLNNYERPIANKYCEGKMKKRTLNKKKRVNRPETVEKEAIETLYSAASGRRGVRLSGLGNRKGSSQAGQVSSLLQVDRQDGLRSFHIPRRVRASASLCGRLSRARLRGFVRSCKYGFYRPVLKHGPRSLTCMRVCWRTKPNTRNESERCQPFGAAPAGHDPPEKD